MNDVQRSLVRALGLPARWEGSLVRGWQGDLEFFIDPDGKVRLAVSWDGHEKAIAAVETRPTPCLIGLQLTLEARAIDLEALWNPLACLLPAQDLDRAFATPITPPRPGGPSPYRMGLGDHGAPGFSRGGVVAPKPTEGRPC